MARLFGTNGIRGIFGEDLTVEFVYRISLALAAHFKGRSVLVGYDGRESSVVMAKTVCGTLNHAGMDCGLAGLVPTPCLEYAVKSLGYDGGVMITASHNPPQYNGLKPVARDGVEFSREDEEHVEEIYFSKKWPPVPDRLGVTSAESRAVPTYIKGIKSRVDSSAIQKRRFTVMLDTGNGAQAVTAPALAREMGCDVVVINEEIDSGFPGRGSEPTPENLAGLSEAVLMSGADLGVAFDGDGDRSIFCDETGRILAGERSALLLADHVLAANPGAAVVTCLNSGSAIDELAGGRKSPVIRTRVGSVEVSRKMIAEDALIGFEENGGFMYGTHNYVRDGAMTLALMLEAVAASGATVSEIAARLPPSHVGKKKVACSRRAADAVIEALRFGNPGADSTDGIRIELGGRRWVMVRPSGTEPILRVYAEAGSDGEMKDLLSEYVGKIESFLKQHF